VTLARYRQDHTLAPTVLRSLRYNIGRSFAVEGAGGHIRVNGVADFGATGIALKALVWLDDADMGEMKERLVGSFPIAFDIAQHCAGIVSDEKSNPAALLQSSVALREIRHLSPDGAQALQTVASRLRHVCPPWRAEFLDLYTSALSEAWHLAPQRALAEAVFDANDDLCQRQQWETAPFEDVRGQIAPAVGPANSSALGSHIMSLVQAARLALSLEDLNRVDLYMRTIRRALHCLAYLVYKDDVEVHHAAQPDILRGGVRTSILDNRVRLVHVHQTLSALVCVSETLADEPALRAAWEPTSVTEGITLQP
jgi:hypothetical protein